MIFQSKDIIFYFVCRINIDYHFLSGLLKDVYALWSAQQNINHECKVEGINNQRPAAYLVSFSSLQIFVVFQGCPCIYHHPSSYKLWAASLVLLKKTFPTARCCHYHLSPRCRLLIDCIDVFGEKLTIKFFSTILNFV